jgi:RNA polymerase sigma-70 factor (ECF subfamily)
MPQARALGGSIDQFFRAFRATAAATMMSHDSLSPRAAGLGAHAILTLDMGSSRDDGARPAVRSDARARRGSDPAGAVQAPPPPATDPPTPAGGPSASALDALWPQVYDELRRLARRSMRGQGQEHTLEPTALVHEAYLKLSRSPRLDAGDQARFLGLAARAMRQILVDHARGKARVKRGDGNLRVELAEGLGATPTPAPTVDLLALHAALDRLAALDERKVRIIEMRYLAGLTLEEVAEVLGLSVPTVKRDAAMAKAWLFRELERS